MSFSITNAPHGFYTVGNEIYFNKVEAIYKASLTNQELKWNFHDDVFGKINWSQRPAGTLRDLYRLRAQQLRDKYDYLILYFSGGMDSWTVLNSFLSNGIHVDEIYTRWTFAERKYREANIEDITQTNISSEYEYAVLPVLEHVKKNYPNINITIHDYSDNFNQTLEEKNFASLNKFQNMATLFKFSHKSDAELIQEKHGKNIAVIIGSDKISYEWKDGVFYAFFRDVSQSDSLDEDRNIELFYWTRDFPEIPVLQAHCLKEYLLLHPDADVKNQNSVDNYEKYRDLYQTVCYPDYDVNTFQVKKHPGTMLFTNENWIYKYNPKFVDSWRWGIKQFFSTIDEKFVYRHDNNMILGLRGVSSPRYIV